MEARKQGSPETSREENDRREQVNNDQDTAGTTAKRTYECTFCKRGFTNAQALGGHMNIHRKDRAKAKQTSSSASSLTSKPNNDHQEYLISPTYKAPSEPPMKYNYNYPSSEAQRNFHYLVCLQPPGPNPRHLYLHHRNDHFLIPRTAEGYLSMNEELCHANLSLQINPTHDEDNREVSKGGEVDLELRLGHDSTVYRKNKT